MNKNECPGRHKCHGPVSWCDECGDVDLVCDDPNCEAHPRGRERRMEFLSAQAEYDRAKAELATAEKRLAEATRKMARYDFGNVVMVARQEGWKP